MDRISSRQTCCIRSLFISDVHLGSPHAQTSHLLHFLRQYQPENLYLVGDFVDGWRLKKRWHWTESANLVLREIVQAAKRGINVRYAIGNHDDFLYDCPLIHGFQASLPFEVADEFVHYSANGKKYAIIHGDRFDNYHESAPVFSRISEATYDWLLRANHMWNRWSGAVDAGPNLSAGIKRQIRSLSRYIAEFEQSLADYARQVSADGVICGHTHVPKSEIINDVHYCNTGDWVENRTALIEHLDGRMELVRHNGEIPADMIPPPSIEYSRSADEPINRISSLASIASETVEV